MTFRLFTDLSPWSTERLMASLRRLFAYSAGVLVLAVSVLVYMVDTDVFGPHRQIAVRGLAVFLVNELCLWFTFIRHWRELQRRQKQGLWKGPQTGDR
ncbi:MAG: hypothetical protein WC708_16205 [Lentisphaeria bacterium]